MAPKPVVKPRSAKISNTSKAVDEFLAQSSVPAGMLERQENEKKEKVKLAELNEKYMFTVAPSSI